ncbi:MAG TPA: glycerol kinase GlpK [Burkholderiales bacterium]|nr:glycerol kinase GlpK [Burkholderiales bacterium]
MSFILALDQGTTSSRAIVFDHSGTVIARAQQELRAVYPYPGWVEQDPREIWDTQLRCATQALGEARITAGEIAAIGISNQRETTLVWERKSGRAVHNAIVWQDRRTADQCESLKAQGHESLISKKTGLVIDPYFSGTKLAWLLDHVKGVRARAESGELAFGTVDSWLIWNLTDGEVHATDVTNASRTLLFNLQTLDWDEELLKLLRIPRALLPRVYPSSGVIAETRLFGSPLPITGIAGDQQAALFGQACFSEGMAKNTYGTGCFMLMQTGEKIIHSKNKLVTTAAWKREKRAKYALEGSVFIAGAVVQWLRDGLKAIGSSREVETFAARDNGGVYFVPAFAGLGAPHWDAFARGTIIGLTQGTGAPHIARAALESIAYQTADVLRAMESDSKVKLNELRVDGGAAENDTLMQFQADLLRIPVVRPEVTETTALGAAYLAGLAVAYWRDEGEILKLWKKSRAFEPKMSEDQANVLYFRWRKALERARNWSKD